MSDGHTWANEMQDAAREEEMREYEKRRSELSVRTGSDSGFLAVEIPRETVETLLNNTIIGLLRTAETMRYNQEHKQWDLLMIHAGRLTDTQRKILNYAHALGSPNTSDEPRAKRVGSG